jgi:hypothetical protein
VKLIFTVESLGNAFNELTKTARGYVPSHLRSGEPGAGLPQLMDAAVRFTAQLAIEAGEEAHDLGDAHDLEGTLIAKLATWVDKEGEVTLRLWTHDMSCVIEGLTRAAHRYAHPHPPLVTGVVKYVMETLPRNLTIAAVAFTIQLVLEETKLPAVGMRGLEGELIRKLEAPWEFGEIPLSVDVQNGPSWGSLSEKE